MSSSRFMGATGPLGPPPAAIAYAARGDFVSENVIRHSAGRSVDRRRLRSGDTPICWVWIGLICLRALRVVCVPVLALRVCERGMPGHLFLILFHSFLRMETLFLVATGAFLRNC